MAAYAEGLNILKHANAGAASARGQRRDHARCAIPTTTSTSSTSPTVAEVWRRGSVVASWLLDLTAEAFLRQRRSLRLRGPRVGLRRRALDEHRGHRRRRACSDPDHGAVRAVHVARRGRLRRSRSSRPCDSASAATKNRRVRPWRARDQTGRSATVGRLRLLRRHRRPGLQADLPGAGGPDPRRGLRSADHRRGPFG